MIERGVETFTTTATVKVPNRFILDQEEFKITDESSKIKVGDLMKIEIGFVDGGKELFTRFEGEITEIFPDEMLTFKGENQAKTLKTGQINLTFGDTAKLSTIIQRILDEVGSDLNVDINKDYTIGSFVIKNETAAQAFQRLSRSHKLAIYVQGDTLYVLYRVLQSPSKSFTYDFERNIFNNNLSFITKTLFKYRSRVVSTLDSGTKVEATAGEEGDIENIYVNDISDQTVLQTIADEALSKKAYDGYKGSFVVPGDTDVRLNDGAELVDAGRLNRTGTYLIHSITERFNRRDGYVHEIGIDLKQ